MECYNFNFECLDVKVAVIYFNKQYYDTVIYHILKDVIFNDDINFFSLTFNTDEISLFVDERFVPNIKDINYTIDKNYRVIRVYDYNDGIQNVGIVSKLSSLLSSSDIPLLYVNSYNNNYILLKEDYLDKAKEILSKTGFVF